jgi:hypothetical protein
MEVAHSIIINYRELYSEPTTNPFGTEEVDRGSCYESVYKVWRATTRALCVDVLLQNILTDFSRPIGGTRVFVQDGTSSTGTLEAVRSVSSYQGVPDQVHDRMKPFASLGDVT